MLNEAVHAPQRILARNPCISASGANCTDSQRQPGEDQVQATLGVFLKVWKVLSLKISARRALKYLWSGCGRGKEVMCLSHRLVHETWLNSPIWRLQEGIQCCMAAHLFLCFFHLQIHLWTGFRVFVERHSSTRKGGIFKVLLLPLTNGPSHQHCIFLSQDLLTLTKLPLLFLNIKSEIDRLHNKDTIISKELFMY